MEQKCIGHGLGQNGGKKYGSQKSHGKDLHVFINTEECYLALGIRPLVNGHFQAEL